MRFNTIFININIDGVYIYISVGYYKEKKYLFDLLHNSLTINLLSFRFQNAEIIDVHIAASCNFQRKLQSGKIAAKSGCRQPAISQLVPLD